MISNFGQPDAFKPGPTCKCRFKKSGARHRRECNPWKPLSARWCRTRRGKQSFPKMVEFIAGRNSGGWISSRVVFSVFPNYPPNTGHKAVRPSSPTPWLAPRSHSGALPGDTAAIGNGGQLGTAAPTIRCTVESTATRQPPSFKALPRVCEENVKWHSP